MFMEFNWILMKNMFSMEIFSCSLLLSSYYFFICLFVVYYFFLVRIIGKETHKFLHNMSTQVAKWSLYLSIKTKKLLL